MAARSPIVTLFSNVSGIGSFKVFFNTNAPFFFNTEGSVNVTVKSSRAFNKKRSVLTSGVSRNCCIVSLFIWNILYYPSSIKK